MIRLLSTKILSQGFKDRLIMHSFSLVEQSFIKISPIQNLKLADSYQAIIFSSQNAVKIALDNSEIKSLVDQKPIYCIGKTHSICSCQVHQTILSCLHQVCLAVYCTNSLADYLHRNCLQRILLISYNDNYLHIL